MAKGDDGGGRTAVWSLFYTYKDRKRIKELSDHRNALQHYGLKYNAYAIESRAARVLDFLITFIHRHLIPGLEPAEAMGVEQDMDTFRLKLKGIETLVKQRMNDLRSELAKVADVTVKCPDCEQWAMVADGREEGSTCLFCHQVWPEDPESAAANYAWIILGLDDRSCGRGRALSSAPSMWSRPSLPIGRGSTSSVTPI